MGAIRIRMSQELFFENFGFPQDVEIIDAKVVEDSFAYKRNIEFVLIGKDFPKVEFGAKPELVIPTFRSETQRIVKLENWGIKKGATERCQK
jgi:hypothetical protein